MIIPIRCFTCNKIIGNKWEPYIKMLRDGEKETVSLEKLGISIQAWSFGLLP